MSRTAHKLMASSGGKGYEIEQSLMFNAADTAHLKRTPSSAGNRRTFTLSAWIKTTDALASSYPAQPHAIASNLLITVAVPFS